jgi:GTP-binding protein EngB required for normal cell division
MSSVKFYEEMARIRDSVDLEGVYIAITGYQGVGKSSFISQ